MIGRRRALLGGVVAGALPYPAPGQDASLHALADLARRAAIYSLPLQAMDSLRWHETVDPTSPRPLRLNQLDHAAMPQGHVLVSSAWADLAHEPMFLALPDMGTRPYSFAVIDMYGDTIDHVSKRLHGRRSTPHVLFGPSWANPPPAGVRAIHATTNLVRIHGWIAFDGVADIASVRALQAAILFETPERRNERRVLEAGELMPSRTVMADEPVAGWPTPQPQDPWDLFVAAARVMGEGPVPARDKPLVAAFATLRLRPGRRFDLLGFSPAERAAILDGIAAARAEVVAAAARAVRTVNGWRLPPVHPGLFGEDRIRRAVIATIDPLMPESAEAVRLVAQTDSAGEPIDGARRYLLSFPPGGIPAGATWSVTVGAAMVDGLRRSAEPEIEIPLPANRESAVSLQIFEPGADFADRAGAIPNISRLQ